VAVHVFSPGRVRIAYLTVDAIFQQLPNYDQAARKLYYAFSFVDYFFPFFAGLVLGAAAAFALRHLSTKWYDYINTRNLFTIFFIATLFDWLENTFALIVVNAYPEELTTTATLLVLAKNGKLASVMTLQGITWILLLLTFVKYAGRKAGLLK